MKSFRFIFAVALLTALIARASFAATTRPTSVIIQESCVTAECHANVKKFTIVHGPVSADTCDACHQLVSAQLHTFSFRAAGTDLCTYCHEFSTAGLATVHK